MWGKCGAYRVFVVNLRERDHLEDLSADERVILKWVFNKWDENIDWIDVVEDGNRWQAVVNTVMNFLFP